MNNGTLLVPGIDYRISEDHTSVELTVTPALNDEVTLMTYSNNVLHSSIAYMQFKDMLNRTTFKRLSRNKRTTLAQDLHWNDTTIVLIDGSAFEIPDPEHKVPGVIEIQGERIEYYAKNGNVLSHLRRATLGTGMAARNPAGTFVQDIGRNETIPYVDTVQNTQVVSNGTHDVNLGFIPTLGNQEIASPNYEPTGVVNWFKDLGYNYTGAYTSSASYAINSVVVHNNVYYYSTKYIPVLGSRNSDVDYTISNTAFWNRYNTTIPVGFGQSDAIEVFVGGYNDTGVWEYGTDYTVGVVVNVGSYTYRCIVDHTSTLKTINGVSKSFNDDISNWALFIGNIRLKKLPYHLHNENFGPYSNSNTDVKFDADFSVNGISPQVRLTNLLAVGTQITVVRRTGIDWDSTTNIMNDTSKIAEFIKAEPGIWYEAYIK